VLIEKKSILAVSRQLIFVARSSTGGVLVSDAALGGVSLAGYGRARIAGRRACWPGLARWLASGVLDARSSALVRSCVLAGWPRVGRDIRRPVLQVCSLDSADACREIRSLELFLVWSLVVSCTSL